MAGYSKAEILAKADAAAKDMATFYAQPFINYRGKTNDTGEFYTEVIADWCLEHPDKLYSIPTITREKTYKTESHDGTTDSSTSNRTEERIAMAMFRQGELPIVGKVIDYQTPLKSKLSDHAGKIDVLAYDGNVIRILELKEPASTETMLRCVVEGFTYWKTVDKEKLAENFDLVGTPVRFNPFVFLDGAQHAEMKEGRPKLTELMEKLDTYPLYISETDGVYSVSK